MYKEYRFNYDFYKAEAIFKVNTEKFTEKIANDILSFFIWDYDKSNNPIDEVMRKFALKAIFIATVKNYNTHGVIEEFKDIEGFCPLDGSFGIELTGIEGYDIYDDEYLSVEISNI